MTEDSKEYILYRELINDIYLNAEDKDEALNILDKLSTLIDMLDYTRLESKQDKHTLDDFVYFPETE